MKEVVRVLVFQGTSGLFIALCLEHDFAVQSKTLEGAVKAFEEEYAARVRTAELRGERPFQRARRAPEEYWTRYESASPIAGVGHLGAQVRAA